MRWTYSPMGYANPDAVTQIANGSATTTYTYDNNGNLISAGTGSATTSYGYDYANRLTSLFAGGATTTYGYDAFGARVIQTGTSTTTFYPFKWYSVASSTGTGAQRKVRIGLEAGPLSQWLFAGMGDAGLAVELLETRHVRNAFKTMPVKTDRKDARGIAELMRLGWFRPVHCKSMEAQETRAILTARKQMQSKLHDVEMSLRGILRGFGLKVGKTTPKTFEGRILELVAGHPTLETVAAGMLSACTALLLAFNGFEKRVRVMARRDARAKLLMTTPSVGAITALTFASAIEDPARFKSSKSVGAHFGMTPKKYQSGETDYSGRISKAGDGSVRTCLYEAAHVMLTRPVKGSALKSWAMRLAKRAGMQKAKVALARKLAVIMHRMLVEGKPFNLAAAAA